MNSNRQQQFAAQFVRHDRRLFGFVITLLPNFDDAEEAYQETCMRIWTKWDDYDPDRDFLAWACGFAKNVVRELRQKKCRAQALLSEQAMERIAEERFRMATASDAWQSQLADCVRELSPPQRDLVGRHYTGEESIKSLADELQTTPAAVYMRLSRIRRLLWECIQRAANARANS
jgi:RNA polymerase sigma-70 factor, ECF subfamily